ncbi:MAG: DUF302 domain-containing protein [Gammaproteobacteria bacterium]|nr:DUF302 domain-containing protein [Gammaproteobacteria bacterium]
MKNFLRNVFLVGIFISANAFASDLIMARSSLSFSEAMTNLQVSLREHGYTVARVQRIDVGLTGMGYKTDMYRVVFVGKADEIKYLVNKYPQMIPYMPPKVSIFAEGGDTLLVTANPQFFAQMIDDEKDKIIFQRWENDVYSVFDDFRNAE